MRWDRFLLLIWIGLLGLAVAARAAEPVVTEVRIEGNRKIESAAIRSKIRLKAGDRFNASSVESDIRSIFSLGFFDRVDAYEEGVAGGVRVIFEVQEKPVISKITFQGLSELDEEDLRAELEVKAFEVLDIHKLNVSVEKFLKKYEEKGHYLADIRYELKPDERRNEVEVVFVIEENDRIRVRSIEFIGNKVVSESELEGVMQTREGGFFSWLSGSGTYREQVFERDVAILQAYYGTLGYVRAQIAPPEVMVSPDKKWISITIAVQEGEQYFVGEVDFQGDLLYTLQELKEDLALVKGEVFNTDTLRRETLRYTEKYADLGYAFANVVPQFDIHDDTRTVDVTFEIDKGRRVFIGNITITGNTKTKDKVIRRELLIHEGELFNGSKKRISRENVMRLGFFDNVEFHQVTSKADPQVVDIEIKVKERSTGQLVIGAGYASGDIGFTAQAQLSQNNFLGNGQVAALSAQIMTGRSFYEFNLSFTEPYVGHSLWSLGGEIYHLRRILTAVQGVRTFEETKTGFAAKLGHPVFEYTNLYLTYRFERSSVPSNTIIDQTLIPPETVNGYSSSVMANLVADKRDDRFDPRNGWYGSLSAEFAGLGGDRRFLRTRGQFKYFHPVLWDLIFRFNLTGANISGWGGSQVPLNELFIQGGLFSLRGYDFLSVGPKRTMTTDISKLSPEAIAANLGGRDIVIGGHNEVLVQAELEFPILKEAKVRGVVFFDAGNAFDGFFFQQQPALLADVGYGIRWFTPIGPLRFELGYPIVGGGSPKFYFTIGPPF